MKFETDIKMTPGALYDYLLYHTYTSMPGIVGTVCGLFMIAVYFMGYPFYCVILGVIVIAYLPITLFLRSRKQYLANPAFKETLHYTFDDEGMSVSQGESTETCKWEEIYKAVSTPGSIVIYTSKTRASIFPKKDLNDKKMLLVQVISTHMDPKKVKIRGN